MRGPVAVLAVFVFSIGILAPVSAAVPQDSTRSPEVPVSDGPALAGMNARQIHAERPAASGGSERMELVAGLALQGILFLVLGYLWTHRSRRRESALEATAVHEESKKQSLGGTDVEDSPASVASKAG